jgi:hypothetical protein
MRTATGSMALLGGASGHNGSNDCLTKSQIDATVGKLAADMGKSMAKWLNDQVKDLPKPEEDNKYAKWEDFL